MIAMISNGLSPVRIAGNVRKGAQLEALRGGPLDKRGAGSRILDAAGRIDELELARLDQFAADKVDASGVVERGLGIEQLRAMMDANFARAAGQRRRIDRSLMEGEWPILLRVIGKTSVNGRYLSLTELRTLFVDRRLPLRITERLEAKVPGAVPHLTLLEATRASTCLYGDSSVKRSRWCTYSFPPISCRSISVKPSSWQPSMAWHTPYAARLLAVQRKARHSWSHEATK